MVEIEVSTKGTEEVIESMKRVEKAADDLSKAIQALGEKTITVNVRYLKEEEEEEEK